MHLKRFLLYLISIFFILSASCDRGYNSYDKNQALRRVLTVQKLQNLNPGNPEVVPQIEAIVDSMRMSGMDAYYFGAVNVLIDRLFSDGRYAEADSLAVRMQQEAIQENDSLAIAMSKRVRAQILYKLWQSDRALEEALSALPYVNNPLQSGPQFGTATSLNEWIHIIAQTKSDTSLLRQSGKLYAHIVKENMSVNSWTDSTAHYQVTALAFEAENELYNNSIKKSEILLDSASRLMLPSLPARAYEHFYETRARISMAKGDYKDALDVVDTLLNTHRNFPWFYLHDLNLKAEVENAAGMHEESAKTYSKFIAFHDSLSTNLTDKRLHDLTLLYRSELNKEEHRTNRIRMIGLGSVSVLLLILLGITFRNAVKERKRNRLLVERLHEYDRAAQTLHQSIPESIKDPKEISEILRLDKHMISDRPYTDPGLSRKELAEYLGISQDALAQLIRNEHDCSVHAYINSFRVEEARRILDSKSEESIAEIASKLGFGTSRTLQRAFKERFDMTPSQYRIASSEIRSSENQ